MDLCWQINCLCFLIHCLGRSYVNCSLRFISDVSLWGKGRGPLSNRSALGPGRDSDLSEGLPGEPLSPLIHTQTRGPSTCPAPAMGPCLLGCVVFCLLQAGESRGQGPLGGANSSISPVTAASVLLLHRGGPRGCHSGPQILGREDRTEGDI